MRDKQIFKRAAQLFGIKHHMFEKLAGGNFSEVYGYRQAGKEYVLRITPPDADLDLSAMQSTLDWQRFLAENGVAAARPVTSSQGRLVEIIDFGEDVYLVSSVEKATGVRAETLPFDTWSAQRIEQLGQVTGKMHTLAGLYHPPPGTLPRPQWNQVSNNFNPHADSEKTPAWLMERLRQAHEAIERLPRPSHAYNLVHADLHNANIVLDPLTDTLTIFDFDDCCYGWFVMDIALPLLDMLVLYPGIDRETFAEHYLTCFLKGYLRANPLEDFWLLQMPIFLKLLEFGLYFQVLPISAQCSPQSWVGKFMIGREENMLYDRPFIDLNMEALMDAMHRSP